MSERLSNAQQSSQTLSEVELLKGQVQSATQKLKEISEQLGKISQTSRVIT